MARINFFNGSSLLLPECNNADAGRALTPLQLDADDLLNHKIESFIINVITDFLKITTRSELRPILITLVYTSKTPRDERQLHYDGNFLGTIKYQLHDNDISLYFDPHS